MHSTFRLMSDTLQCIIGHQVLTPSIHLEEHDVAGRHTLIGESVVLRLLEGFPSINPTLSEHTFLIEPLNRVNRRSEEVGDIPDVDLGSPRPHLQVAIKEAEGELTPINLLLDLDRPIKNASPPIIGDGRRDAQVRRLCRRKESPSYPTSLIRSISPTSGGQLLIR